MPVLTVSEHQLRLLWNSGHQVDLLLAHFIEPHSPSDVARALEWPASRVHYWVTRLREADLLVRVGTAGRKHIYQLAAKKYRVPVRLLPSLLPSIPASIAKSMSLLGRGLTTDLYRWHEYLHDSSEVDDITGEKCIELDISDQVTVRTYAPMLQTLRIRATANRYAVFMEKLSALLTEFGEAAEPEGDYWMLALVGYRDS